MDKKVSGSVINRLPRYYRHLTDLCSSGTERISSKELSERMGVTASQIRQDLNCFGGFGQQGYGYNVEMLRTEIANMVSIVVIPLFWSEPGIWEELLPQTLNLKAAALNL